MATSYGRVNGGHPVAAHREDAEAAWKWLTEYGPQLAHEKNVSLEKIQVGKLTIHRASCSIALTIAERIWVSRDVCGGSLS